MNEGERQQILEQIRNLESLIANASSDNADMRRWKQEIENLKSRLNF
jgi:hypothetical protein